MYFCNVSTASTEERRVFLESSNRRDVEPLVFITLLLASLPTPEGCGYQISGHSCNYIYNTISRQDARWWIIFGLQQKVENTFLQLKNTRVVGSWISFEICRQPQKCAQILGRWVEFTQQQRKARYATTTLGCTLSSTDSWDKQVIVHHNLKKLKHSHCDNHVYCNKIKHAAVLSLFVN